MSDDQRALLAPAAVLLSATVASVAIWVNSCVNARNRRIRAAIDLFNLYYANEEFVRRRLELWSFLTKKKEEPGIRWDFVEWFKVAQEKSDVQLLQYQVTLNRVAAFFLGVTKLIEYGEIDVHLASNLFNFTYSHWDQYRQLFYRDTPKGASYVFSPTPFTALTGGLAEPI